MLKADNLSFAYAGTPVFSDVSLTLAPGSITALLGPSGTGKTTLLKCLALLEKPQAGRIAVDDDVYDFGPQAGANPPPPWPRLTVVFQGFFLWPHLTLKENILLPVRKRDGAANEKRLADLSARFGMDEFLDRYPNETSGGQKQRAALVRALMLEPRYILCDEITSALDIEQVGKLLDCLRLVKEQGAGILLITHSLSFARRMADHVMFMDNGGIVEQGGRDCLITPQTDRFAAFLRMVEAAH